MEFSRRDLGFLLPALAAVNARAQEQGAALDSKVYHSAKIAY